jgi:hypothetical protein
VPAISAGGAVEEPLPSTSIATLGYIERKPSAHSVIRLFIVSEPMLFTEPDTPSTGLYSGNFGSTLTDWAAGRRARSEKNAGASRESSMDASSWVWRRRWAPQVALT